LYASHPEEQVVRQADIRIGTKGNCDIIDITEEVEQAVAGSGIADGIVCVFSPGATAGVTTIEYESGLLKDLEEMMELFAPKGRGYHHDARWGDGNGHSHLRASLLGPSLSVPVRNSTLVLGTWQQIVFIDFDARPRERSVVVQIVGE
jgi:secondary thiamine-phosphate synthase enzyme